VARDLGRYGVTCNGIAPGAATRMTQTVPQAARDLRARAGIAGAGGQAPAGAAGGAPAAAAGGGGGGQRPQGMGGGGGGGMGGGGGQGMPLNAPEMVAPMVCFLATDYAWNINGQMFGVSGGQVSVLHHPLAMRTIYKPAMWTLDELDQMVPRALMAGIPNPAPPAPDLEIPGRPAQAPAQA
jgi:NAD(P)-dependent dehydrogenase (short-subunit alcohol dehydrogenase family)